MASRKESRAHLGPRAQRRDPPLTFPLPQASPPRPSGTASSPPATAFAAISGDSPHPEAPTISGKRSRGVHRPPPRRTLHRLHGSSPPPPRPGCRIHPSPPRTTAPQERYAHYVNPPTRGPRRHDLRFKPATPPPPAAASPHPTRCTAHEPPPRMGACSPQIMCPSARRAASYKTNPRPNGP